MVQIQFIVGDYKQMSSEKYVSHIGIYKADIKNESLFIQFDHEKDTNPFSRKLTIAITQLCETINNDASIKSVIFTGGKDRSFSAGGDFNDVSKLKEREETRLYLYEIIDLYQAILKINKPTLSLIDHYAIGQGLQVALMTDYRVATTRTQIAMPELKNGVACPLGATILQNYFGHAQMLEDVIGCSMMNATEAYAKKYFNIICEPTNLSKVGGEVVEKFNKYAPVPFMRTKEIYNQKILNALENVRIAAGEAHIETILSKSADQHFEKILNKK